MDKISKAIELARESGALIQKSSRNAINGKIVYTTTTNLEIDQEFLRQQRILVGLEDPYVSEAYKVLRTQVMQRMIQNKWKTLGISSSGVDEGKTLTAINLAISISLKLDYSVVLVDADLKRPSLHKMFGFSPELGITDYLKGDVPVENLLVSPGINRLVLLPGRSGNADSSELLASPRMLDLVKELKTRYPNRVVLFDLPPVLVGDDVIAFAPHLDAMLLVVEENKTQSDMLSQVVQLMSGVEVLGTVLNKSKEKKKNLGYGY